jgi:uncharacterized protein (DUF433 family)
MASTAPFDIGTLITSTPNVYGGRPCLAGTRFPVTQIAAHLRAGHSAAHILERFPHLGEARIHAGITYYFANKEEVDAELDADIARFEQSSRAAR